MDSKTGNIEISIILVLSITAVLITGTVVNIVSAANSGVKVKPKTYQHPVASIGTTHIVPSAARGSLKLQPKTNLVTSTRSPYIISSAHGTKCKSGPCPNGIWGSEFTLLQFTHLVSGQYSFKGQLKGETYDGTFHGIKSAPVHFGVAFRDNHASIIGPAPVRTSMSGDGTFNGAFSACDDPKYTTKDHTSYFTAYFDGGYQVNIDTSIGAHGEDWTYDYKGTTSLHDLGGDSRLLSIDMCKAEARFTDMQITPGSDRWYIKGKLVGEGNLPLSGAVVIFSAKYLDDTPTHPHPFIWSSIPFQQTMAGGTIDSAFSACDHSTGSGYRSDAQFYVIFPNPKDKKFSDYYFPASWPSEGFAFTTKPCTGVDLHDSKNRISDR
jgi:hypothetical protein